MLESLNSSSIKWNVPPNPRPDPTRKDENLSKKIEPLLDATGAATAFCGTAGRLAAVMLVAILLQDLLSSFCWFDATQRNISSSKKSEARMKTDDRLQGHG